MFERLYTKHEERKQGLREETKAARVQNVEPRGGGRSEGREGLTREKGEYKAIRYGYCESSSETRNPGALPISSFALLRGLHSATPTAREDTLSRKRSERFPHIYLVRDILRAGAANAEKCKTLQRPARRLNLVVVRLVRSRLQRGESSSI